VWLLLVVVISSSGKPGMGEDCREVDPVLGSDPQAGLHQVPALGAHRPAEGELGAADLVVLFEGDVAADHVEEQDAEGPDGEGGGTVAVAADPLRRCVHSGTCKIKIKIILIIKLPVGIYKINYQESHVTDSLLKKKKIKLRNQCKKNQIWMKKQKNTEETFELGYRYSAHSSKLISLVFLLLVFKLHITVPYFCSYDNTCRHSRYCLPSKSV
jgi:hypothetical protein